MRRIFMVLMFAVLLLLPVAVQAQCSIGLTIYYMTPFGIFTRYEIGTVLTDYAGCRDALDAMAREEFQTWNVLWVSGRAILVDDNGARYYFSTHIGPR